MPSYKLHYFDARGRAEICRFIFALAGVDYEDKRYTGEEWATAKATGKFIFGQMPALEVDDVMLVQSNAIARYLANEHGIMGKTNLDNAKIDMIVDTLTGDLGKAMTKFFFEKDETKKAELTEEFKTKTLPLAFAALEKLLIANKGGDGFFVGDGVSLADLTFVTQSDMIRMVEATALDNYPKLNALRDRVLALPKIAEWVKKRPDSKF